MDSITVIQVYALTSNAEAVYALTSNAEEVEVELVGSLKTYKIF